MAATSARLLYIRGNNRGHSDEPYSKQGTFMPIQRKNKNIFYKNEIIKRKKELFSCR